MDTTYNGWTNYVTWAVNLWLTNEPGTSDALSEIAMTDRNTVSERGDILKSFVEEAYDFPTNGLASDLLTYAMQSVNWREIIENHQDDGE